jgi:hypothetical protein
MHPEQLVAPDGMAIFAKPLPVIWHDEEGNVEHRIAAISWGESVSTNDGRSFTSITAWHRETGIHRESTGVTIRYTGLRPQSHSMGAPWIEPQHVGGPASPHRLLQALSALIRTPLVRDEITPSSKAARRDAERADLRDTAVRRIHLRRPEHAEHELEAARDARRNRPSRGHWVRGHWKKQWYPSIEEHRPVWITGYPRGDFAVGVVSGTKVLVASERKSAKPPETTP